MQHTYMVVGDPHIRLGDVYTDKLVDSICAKATEYKDLIKGIILMGDILHTHERLHIVPLGKAHNLINRLSMISHVYVIIGNHDRCNNNDFCTDVHAFSAYDICDRVTVVWKPICVEIGDMYICLCPYVPPGRFREALKQVITFTGRIPDRVDINKVSCIFAHQEMYGCTLSGVSKSSEGDVWKPTYPFIASGHIHKHHRPHPNIMYVGTPRQTDFGEESDTYKRIWLFSFDSVSGKLCTDIKDIDICMPMYRTVECDYDNLDSLHIDDPSSMVRCKIMCGNHITIKDLRNMPKINMYARKGCKICIVKKGYVSGCIVRDTPAFSDVDFISALEGQYNEDPTSKDSAYILRCIKKLSM